VTLRVYLTGNVAIEDGDRLVAEGRFPGRQGRLAFAVLAWERAHATSIDELADVVWDGRPPNAWQTALRALVSKLSSVLGEAATIEQAFGCYQLRLPADAWIDVEACSAAVHEAELAMRDEQPDLAMGPALVANAIAGRPFLPGDVSEWSERKREHLRGLRMRALDVRARVALAHGDPIGAATDAAIVVDLDPYRESAYGLLMRAQIAAGDPARAVASYETLRSRLAEDLGTQPSAETEAVFLNALAAGRR
jgi:SARP family transcriptional regulator, regulator of embCAB operon